MQHKADLLSVDAGQGLTPSTGVEPARPQSSLPAASSGPLVYRRRGIPLLKAVQKRTWRGRKHHHQGFTQLLGHDQHQQQQQQQQQQEAAAASTQNQTVSASLSGLRPPLMMVQQQHAGQHCHPHHASPVTSPASSASSDASTQGFLLWHKKHQKQLQRQATLQSQVQHQQPRANLQQPQPNQQAAHACSAHASTATRFEAASLATKALLSLAAVHASPAVAQQLQQQLMQSMRKPTAHAAFAGDLDTAGEMQQRLPRLQEDVIRECSKAAAARAADASLRNAARGLAGSASWAEAVAAAATEATAAALRMTTLVEPVVTAVSELHAAALQPPGPQAQMAADGRGRSESSRQALQGLQQLVAAIIRS
uniref:Uncharacterized protein n=1 Tax=Tetradesmus obliquus TaxID=3088 RepID=A0A383VID1_TETOB|eukprot:jgi/Sobl393_1/8365/SZX64693.1